MSMYQFSSGGERVRVCISALMFVGVFATGSGATDVLYACCGGRCPRIPV